LLDEDALLVSLTKAAPRILTEFILTLEMLVLS
jgi:hypothetical protein